jgi:hypothetical protein
MLIFFYVPALMALPILLIVGIVFVIVPGGFIVVAVALWYVLMSFLGMVGLAATRWQVARATRRRDRAGSAVTPQTTGSPARPIAATATPITAGFLNGQSAGLPRDLLASRLASARSARDERLHGGAG